MIYIILFLVLYVFPLIGSLIVSYLTIKHKVIKKQYRTNEKIDLTSELIVCLIPVFNWLCVLYVVFKIQEIIENYLTLDPYSEETKKIFLIKENKKRYTFCWTGVIIKRFRRCSIRNI